MDEICHQLLSIIQARGDGMNTEYKGIFTALTTPFEDQEVHLGKFRENIQKYNTFELSGYVIGGSTGEFVFLTDEECLSLVKTAAQTAAAGRKLIAGTARESVIGTIAFTHRAADMGAQAALIVLPHYYQGAMNQVALQKYYEAIADAVPIPVLIYSIPRNTGIVPSAQLIIDLSQHPNILGIKDSSGNLSLLQEAYPAMRSETTFLLGAGSILLPGLQMGASGGILTLAAVVPELCSRLYGLFQEKWWEQAFALQGDLVPLNQAVTKYYGVPAAKYALDLLGFHGGSCRLPLLPLETKVKTEIRDILVALKLI